MAAKQPSSIGARAVELQGESLTEMLVIQPHTKSCYTVSVYTTRTLG